MQACQDFPLMEFPRQEHRSGLPFPSPGGLPDPGIESGSLTLHGDSLLTEAPGKPLGKGRLPLSWGRREHPKKRLRCYFHFLHEAQRSKANCSRSQSSITWQRTWSLIFLPQCPCSWPLHSTTCTRPTTAPRVSGAPGIQSIFFKLVLNETAQQFIEWERLEISSRKLDIQREHFMQRWAQ